MLLYQYRSIRINTRISKECVTIHCCYDVLCTALFKVLFHVPLLYFEHLPLQSSLHGPAVLKYIFQVSVLYWSSFNLSNFCFYFTTFQSSRSYFTTFHKIYRYSQWCSLAFCSEYTVLFSHPSQSDTPWHHHTH